VTLSDSPVQPHPDPISAPATAEVVGVPIAVIDYGRTLEWIDAMVDERRQGYVCVCNVHTVMSAREDPALQTALLSSSLNVPDGQPLVWALNALGRPLRDRVYGPELMARAFARARSNGHRFYLYGGRDHDALVQLGLSLRRRFPGVNIVGGYAPPFRPLTTEERSAIIDEINESEADVVWVGIGVPKQEKWMAVMRSHLEAPVLVGVGAAFDFHAGLVPQAPPLLQGAGLEWAYRLAHEPRRLWRRYLRYNPRFVGAFARQLVARRSAGERPEREN
jgi:N-acetylglucosaminyldiphosphoundecaprenol N-acetyl-beta-D-mannosaminyltransferase